MTETVRCNSRSDARRPGWPMSNVSLNAYGQLLFVATAVLNQSRKESIERSEHHPGNLLVSRADAAGTASNLHEVITAFSRGNRTSDGIRARSRQLAYETLTSPVVADAETWDCSRVC
jgi:hypothetical protein